MEGLRAEQAAGLVPTSTAEPDGEAGQGSKSQPDVRTLQIYPLATQRRK